MVVKTSTNISKQRSHEISRKTELIGLISEEKPNWKLVDRRLKAKPEEARIWYVERKENTGKIVRKFLPIHNAFMSASVNAPLRLIEHIYKAFPEGLQCADGDGMLPLHWALWSRAQKDVVEFVLNKYPEGIRLKDRFGRLPLHIACENGVSHKVIVRRLVDANPSSIKAQNSLGHTPFDQINWKDKQNQKDFAFLETLSKSQDIIPTFTSDVPVTQPVVEHQSHLSALTDEHSARLIKYNQSNGKSVQEYYVGSLSSRNSGEGTSASRQPRQPVSLVEKSNKVRQSSFLSNSSFDPSMAQVMEGMKDFLEKHRSQRVLSRLDSESVYRANPLGTSQPDDVSLLLPSLSERMNLRLEEGEARSNSNETQNTLLALAIIDEQWNHAIARLQNKTSHKEAHQEHAHLHQNGDSVVWLPLHEACSRNPPKNLIHHLCMAYAEGFFKKDSRGRLPIHIACESGCSVDVIKYLLNVNPDSVNVKDNAGQMPKECLRQQHRNFASVLRVIEEHEISLKQEHKSPYDMQRDTLRQPLIQKNGNRDIKTSDDFSDDEGQTGTFTGKVVRTSDDKSIVSGLADDYGPMADEGVSSREEFINCCLCFALIALLIATIIFSLVFDNDTDNSSDEPTVIENISSEDSQDYEVLASSDGIEIIDLDKVLNSSLNPFR